MLSLPPSQRTQVRDELEDHLRSRVDDLLITGQTEARAIRTAIAELGETAQLARHISSANRTPRSFRRFAMNATFFVLAGSILTAGVSMMLPATAPLGNAQPAAVADDVVQDSGELVTKHFDMENAGFYEVMAEVSEAFNHKLILSDKYKQQQIKDKNWSGTGSFKGEMTLDAAIRRIQGQFADIFLDAKMIVSDDRILLLTLAEFERSRVVIRAYPMPTWVDTEDDQRNFSFAVQQLISTKHDLEYTTIQPINGSLVVAAPPEVHAEIVDMSDQLQALSNQMREKNEQRRAAQREAKRRQIERLRARYESAKQAYFSERDKDNELKRRSNAVNERYFEMRRRKSQDELAKTQLKELETVSLQTKEAASQQEIATDEAKARFERFQQILIDAEADLILSDLNNPIPIDAGASSEDGHTVTVLGEVGRPGVYALSDQGALTLSRFLLVAGEVQNSDAQITLQRAEDIMPIGHFTDLQSSGHADMKLEPGDLVRVFTVD